MSKKIIALISIICVIAAVGIYKFTSTQKTTATEPTKVNEEVVEKEFNVEINGSKLTLEKSGEENSKDVEQLSSISPNELIVSEVEGVESVKINDKDVDFQESVEFEVAKISEDDKVKISVKFEDEEEIVDYYLNTYTSKMPGYNVTANSPYDGEYYIATHNEEHNFIFKLDSKGEMVFYKELEANAFDFKKIETQDGKIRYGYMLVDKEASGGRIGGVGYSATKLVIMDEDYKEINEIKLSAYDDVQEGEPLENHDYIYIDDNHYLLSAYRAVDVTNIPEELTDKESVAVVAEVIQEVKDGQVIWQWDSTDYDMLYDMSVEANTYNEENESPLDYVHFNSMTIDEKDNNLICSFRNADCILKLDRKTGEIIWILGGKNDQFGLTEEQLFSRQHNARLTEDGYLTLYDNGVANESSRAIKMKIDEEEMKVVEFKDYPVDGFYKYTGSVQEIDAEKEVFLIGLGTMVGKDQELVAIEKNFSTGEVYFKLGFESKGNMYRIYKF